MESIFEYLKNGMVVNIFYLYNKQELKKAFYDYFLNGTKSLERKRMVRKGKKSEMRICEYRCYKVLTFIDTLRETKYKVLASIYDMNLFDYLIDYITSSCEEACFKYEKLDFFTHYHKNILDLITKVELEKNRFDNDQFKITFRNYFPSRGTSVMTLPLLDTKYNNMMDLDPDRVYRVVALRIVGVNLNEIDDGLEPYEREDFGKYSDYVEPLFEIRYLITLFDYIGKIGHFMRSNFLLPNSAIGEIMPNVVMPDDIVVGENIIMDRDSDCIDNTYKNNFISIVGIQKDPSGRDEVVIKRHTPKSFKELGV